MLPVFTFIFISHFSLISFFFFFNDTATTEIYTLSLHDALPIYRNVYCVTAHHQMLRLLGVPDQQLDRSEEHTSELQSLAYLVCRLLLEKKKIASIKKLEHLHITQLASDIPRFVDQTANSRTARV